MHFRLCRWFYFHKWFFAFRAVVINPFFITSHNQLSSISHSKSSFHVCWRQFIWHPILLRLNASSYFLTVWNSCWKLLQALLVIGIIEWCFQSAIFHIKISIFKSYKQLFVCSTTASSSWASTKYKDFRLRSSYSCNKEELHAKLTFQSQSLTYWSKNQKTLTSVAPKL